MTKKIDSINDDKKDEIADKSAELKADEKPDDLSTADLTRQNQEYLAGWQRAKADYINLKRETDEMIGKLRQIVRGELFIEFLPYWQNFVTAIKHIPKDLLEADWVQGFIHTQRQIEDWLDKNGVKKMKTVGEKFDYNKHEAVETVWDEKVAVDEIVAEKSAGYEYDGQVLIHPRVVVNTLPTNQDENKNNQVNK